MILSLFPNWDTPKELNLVKYRQIYTVSFLTTGPTCQKDALTFWNLNKFGKSKVLVQLDPTNIESTFQYFLKVVWLRIREDKHLMEGT